METFIDVDELKVVGGATILDLANTQSGPPGGSPDVESLRDYGDLLRWGVRVGALDEREAMRLTRKAEREPVAARAAFARTLELRGDAYEVFAAIASGGRSPEPSLNRLKAAATEGLAHASLAGADGTVSIRWIATDDPDRAWWPVAYAGLEFLLHGQLDRVKGCGGCRYLFLDETKNHSRRWCSMDDCGTREKMRTYVAKRAARRSATLAP